METSSAAGFLGLFGGRPSGSLSDMHAQGAVIRMPLGVVVVGHEAASTVLKDPATFSSEPSRSSAILGRLAGAAARMDDDVLGARSMLASDPPDHERLRGVVAKAFTPRTVAALEPRVRQIATELLEPLASGERYELIDRLAAPLPVIVIAELLGIPVEDRELFKRWSDDLLVFNDPAAPSDGMERARSSRDQLAAYFLDVIDERRASPRDDLVSRLVAANEGGVLSKEELVRQCILLLVAGNETTTHLIGNAVHTLSDHPDQRRRLEDDPSLVPNTVEEVLRYNGVVVGTARVVRGEVELAGEQLGDGQIAIVFILAANRDPSRFENPDVFDVGRANAAQNLGFGGGIHYCLGAALARQETRVALETLGHLAPNWRLADPAAPVEYTLFLRGPKRLDLVA